MKGPQDLLWWACCAASFALSALITTLAIRYAQRRNLYDLPGKRRSHSVPTPRGGGIAIVLTAIVACALVPLPADASATVCLLGAIVLVAAVGWIDDHRGLAARWRLLAHFLAAALIVAPLFAAQLHAASASMGAVLPLAAVVVMAIIGCAWSINLHNFMDGINGLLALQALFVFFALAVFDMASSSTYSTLIVLWAAAVAGFLPFNFPRAHIFMGDVGSGVLGLLVAVAVIWQWTERGAAPTTGLIACSAFATDATCTLLSRMLRGRRWYSAHREHLYQWLARSGFSHAGVVALYMGWNLFVVLPVLYLVNRDYAMPPQQSQSGMQTTTLVYAVTLYALAVFAWFAGKRWCLQKVKML